MDKETAIKSIEKGIRIAEAAESGWVWITFLPDSIMTIRFTNSID